MREDLTAALLVMAVATVTIPLTILIDWRFRK